MQRENRNAAASKERILQTATELFAARGYTAAGVDMVAAQAGIAKTAIYYHFGSKEGLLAAVLERAATTWIETIKKAAQRAGTPPERLELALGGLRLLIEERPWILKLIQLLALEFADEKAEVRATLQTIVQRARGAILSGMREALGGELPGANVVASMLLATLDGIALGHHMDTRMISLDEAFAELRRILAFMIAIRINPELGVWFDESLRHNVLAEFLPLGKSGDAEDGIDLAGTNSRVVSSRS